MDAHQVRRWRSWRRWTILAMLARTFLAVTAATATPCTRGASRHGPDLTLRLPPGEVRRPLTALTATPPPDTAHILRWSLRRRHQQARAAPSHYARQAQTIQ